MSETTTRRRRNLLANSAETPAAPATAPTAPEKTEELTLDEAIEIAVEMLEEAYNSLASIDLLDTVEKVSMSINGGKNFNVYKLGSFMGAELLISERKLKEIGADLETRVAKFLKGNPSPIDGKIWIRQSSPDSPSGVLRTYRHPDVRNLRLVQRFSV